MKIKHLLIGVSLVISGLSFSQNEYTPDYAQFILEFEQNVNEKSMSKDWKKRKSTWETEVQGANSLEDLNKLFEEFTTNLNPKVVEASKLPKVKLNGEYYYNGQSLVSFANAFPKDQLKEDFKLEEFNTSVKAKTSDIKEIEAKKDKEREQNLIKTNFSDFEKVFTEVWEDSKKGSFINTIDRKSGTTCSVRNKMKAADESNILISDENIYAYHTTVIVGKDLDLARDMLNNLMKKIESDLLPGGYGMHEWMEDIYVDRVRFEYEFEHEEFRVSAKQPTCYIAIVQKDDNYYIKWGITEPVFKDWGKSNKDWNK